MVLSVRPSSCFLYATLQLYVEVIWPICLFQDCQFLQEVWCCQCVSCVWLYRLRRLPERLWLSSSQQVHHPSQGIRQFPTHIHLPLGLCIFIYSNVYCKSSGQLLRIIKCFLLKKKGRLGENRTSCFLTLYSNLCTISGEAWETLAKCYQHHHRQNCRAQHCWQACLLPGWGQFYHSKYSWSCLIVFNIKDYNLL